jgi:hypothetical protein
MIEIFFSGQQKHKKYLERFAHSVLNHLLDDLDLHETDIEIRSESVLSEHATGYCWGDHEYLVIELARGYYDENGRYRRHKFVDIVQTLAHELVHAKQNMLREKLDHKKREREAYRLERALLKRFWKKHYPLT